MGRNKRKGSKEEKKDRQLGLGKRGERNLGRKWGQEGQDVPIINLQYFNSLSSTVKG